MKFINDYWHGQHQKDPEDHGTDAFPLAVYKLIDSPKHLHNDSFYLHLQPHYHDEFEIFYLRRGNCTYCVNGIEYQLKEGSLIFNWPKTIHFAYIGTSDTNTINVTTVFRRTFLTGFSNDVVSNDYLSSLFSDFGTMYPLLTPDIPWQNEIIEKYKEMISFFEEKTDDELRMFQVEALKLKSGLLFPEFKIKLLLLEMFYLYLTNMKIQGDYSNSRKKSSAYLSVIDSTEYIHQHYSEKLSLSEISQKVYMSEDYFSREFQKYIGCSPFTYINNYRIYQSLNLITGTKMNIIDIAMSCGFRNISYFNRKFKELMKCTPKQYRESMIDSTNKKDEIL